MFEPIEAGASTDAPAFYVSDDVYGCSAHQRMNSGEYAAGCLMMRFIDGKPIYRAMTIEEEQDFGEGASI